MRSAVLPDQHRIRPDHRLDDADLVRCLVRLGLAVFAAELEPARATARSSASGSPSSRAGRPRGCSVRQSGSLRVSLRMMADLLPRRRRACAGPPPSGPTISAIGGDARLGDVVLDVERLVQGARPCGPAAEAVAEGQEDDARHRDAEADRREIEHAEGLAEQLAAHARDDDVRARCRPAVTRPPSSDPNAIGIRSRRASVFVRRAIWKATGIIMASAPMFFTKAESTVTRATSTTTCDLRRGDVGRDRLSPLRGRPTSPRRR